MSLRQAVVARASWLDKAISLVAPGYALSRIRARLATEALRHYEAATMGRRGAGWGGASGGDANAVMGLSLHTLRARARDLVRNNGNARAALRQITNNVVGWGIVGKPVKGNAEAAKLWKAWAETTACDTEGRLDFYGIQKLVLRTVAESGECIVRRRIRRPEDGLPIPMQLQVLDPDYLDTERTGVTLPNGHRIVHGVEYDQLARRAAYYLFPQHPGSEVAMGQASVRVPAESVTHVFHSERPGQVRGATWFASVLVRFKDHHEYADATLMKQKVAACLAVLVSDLDGSSTALGQADGMIDSLEPGWIGHVPQGTQVTAVEPPTVAEFADYSKATLRECAAGLGVSYSGMTGDYTGMPFSAARMERLTEQGNVEDWRWQMLIPQLCSRVWAWAMEVAVVMEGGEVPEAEWTPPAAPMIDPANEGLAYMRNIRVGLQTWPEVIRERGRNPEEVLREIADWNARLDKLGITLDSDARRTTQAGNPVAGMLGAGGGGGGTPPTKDEDPPQDDGAGKPAAGEGQEATP